MSNNRVWNRRCARLFGVVGAGTVLLTGCGSAHNTAGNTSNSNSNNTVAASTSTSKKQPLTITMMTAGGQLTHAAPNSPLWKQLEQDTNANIKVQWITSNNYDAKVSVELASGNPPDVLRITHTTSAVQSAAKSGAFWNLGPYLKNYKYLDAINPIIYKAIEINGNIYGIPAARTLARMGIVYRKDWLKNVGLPAPTTWKQFYNMLHAFTYDDPNKDGKNDTYGLVLSKDSYPLVALEPTFGVPFNYKVVNGKLVPAQQTPQYFDALNAFHKLYVNKLINQNFAEVPVSKALKEFLDGKAGAVIRIANAHDFVSQNPALKGKIGVVGPLKGPNGSIGDYGGGGNDGMFVIPKQAVKTVAQLKQVLSFMNAMSSPKVENLLHFGVEGQNYKLVNGIVVPINTNNPKIKDQTNDLLEMTPLLQSSLTLKEAQTPLQKQVTNIEQGADMKYLKLNPAATLYSKTEVQEGSQLNTILTDAMFKYIAGQIPLSGVKQANQTWLKDGGSKVLQELDASLAKSKQ